MICPNCKEWVEVEPVKHRGELERQLGDVEHAGLLRFRADVKFGREEAFRLDENFIAWKGYVWAKVRVRKPAKCIVSGAAIAPGAWAWRQLSEVENRDWRVSVDAWSHL